MKIAFIEPGLHVCGGIRRIVETSNHLVDLGHDVTVFSPKGGPCTWLPTKFKYAKLSKLEKFEFDVSVFNLADQYKTALSSQATLKVFWVLAPEGMYKHPAVPVKAINRPEFYCVANSKFTVSYINKYSSIQRKSIPIVYGGLNRGHFKYDPAIKKDFHVLYYGSNRPWKGASIIEESLRGSKLKSLKMDGLNTPQNRMYTLYNSSTIFVSAGQVEGFNFPILEAMICGCPVVCTDDGGNRDFVVNGHNAIVAKRDPQSIRKAVLDLINNRDSIRKLRRNGLKTALSPKFTWEHSAKTFEQAIVKKLNER